MCHKYVSGMYVYGSLETNLKLLVKWEFSAIKDWKEICRTL